MSETTYFASRAGALMLFKPHEPMRKYVFEELKQAKQQELLRTWKEISR